MGSTGTGKSFISCTLGYKACIHEYRLRYYNCLKLFSHLKFCKVNCSYFKEMDNLKKQDLIILDYFGLKHFDSESRLIMLDLIEDRHGVRSTIIASQLTADKWFEIIGDAICDRLFHTSHKLSIVDVFVKSQNVPIRNFCHIKTMIFSRGRN